MGNFNYYQNLLDSLDVKNAEYPATLNIRADSKSTNFISLNDVSANVISKWLNENYNVLNSEISNVELLEHLDKWFGKSWDNKSGGQIFAMVLDLLEKVKVNVKVID